MTPALAATKPGIVIETRFGAFAVREEAIVIFPEGLPGFARCTRFVLLSSDAIAPLTCLQAIDSPAPSFLAVDPALVVPRYRRALTVADHARLGGEADDLVWLALVTVQEGENAFVNLRAPIVINPARMIGIQAIPHRNHYQVRHPLPVG